MSTFHTFLNTNANNLSCIPNNSINLIVTSPPYPMIQMWDEVFYKQDSEILSYLQNGKTNEAFEKMHLILDDIWKECYRVLADGGFACINIGDAVRTFNDKFQLFSNHTRIINTFLNLGFTLLPDIHWRKQTNSPNKFMGSGMYPAGAYVTYEHEYILIFRKGNKRNFKENDKLLRQNSAYFWEERNEWFSDLWEIKGTKQTINKIADRERNGSFPVDIPYRLINMYSVYGDTVLDPFGGLGTTTLAAIINNRNSISVDISESITDLAKQRIINSDTETLNEINNQRINNHISFINSLSEDKKEKCYQNINHSFLTKTRQETNIKLYDIKNIKEKNEKIICEYEKSVV